MGCVGWVGCVGKVGRGGCVGSVGLIGGDVGGFGSLLSEFWWKMCLMVEMLLLRRLRIHPTLGKIRFLFFSPIIFFDHLGEYEAVHFLSAQS